MNNDVVEEPLSDFSIQDILSYKMHHIGAMHERIAYGNMTRITGVTLSQWRVLGNIASGFNTFTMLAKELLLDPGQLSNTIKQLQTKQLVAKHQSNLDRRQTLLSITPLGQQTITTIMKMVAEFHTMTLRQVSAEEVSSLERALLKIEANMRNFLEAK